MHLISDCFPFLHHARKADAHALVAKPEHRHSSASSRAAAAEDVPDSVAAADSVREADLTFYFLLGGRLASRSV
jgi:hypothetical protein